MINSITPNLLDCTLRDGGYYNNWNFSKSLIDDYLSKISKTNITHIELGFRFFKKDYPMGLTAYTDDKLISSLNIPSNLSIGVMVNAADLKKNGLDPLTNLKKLFPKIHKRLDFVRFACHFDEVFILSKCVKWLKKNNIQVFINIMQISEIKKLEIQRICYFLKKTEVETLYIADSLGSLTSKSLIKIIKDFKKFWKKNLGLHAHNNLNLALKNSLTAVKNNFKWIDCTITGMGRGPGNLRTEDILIKYYPRDLLFIDKLKKNFFTLLKKKYKWGPNQYYKLAALYKIHPTYIQKMLSDSRFKKTNYTSILKNLKKIDAKKFEPTKLYLGQKHRSRKKVSINNWSPRNLLNNKDILIFGPAESVKNNKIKIEKFLKKKNLFVIGVNSSSGINENLVNLRTICHPRRFISDSSFLSKVKTPIIFPDSLIPLKLKKLINLKNKQVFDYDLKISKKNIFNISNNSCEIPIPLVIIYTLAIVLTGKAKRIYVAGFDGFKDNNPNIDETNYLLNIFRKKYQLPTLKTITKSRYKISQLKI